MTTSNDKTINLPEKISEKEALGLMINLMKDLQVQNEKLQVDYVRIENHWRESIKEFEAINHKLQSQLEVARGALTKLLGHLPPYDDEGKMTYAINLINETLEKVEK